MTGRGRLMVLGSTFLTVFALAPMGAESAAAAPAGKTAAVATQGTTAGEGTQARPCRGACRQGFRVGFRDGFQDCRRDRGFGYDYRRSGRGDNWIRGYEMGYRRGFRAC